MAGPIRDPSVGIDAETGGAITGWAHVEQSLGDTFFTRFGERIMREWYGSFVPALLGQNITPHGGDAVFRGHRLGDRAMGTPFPHLAPAGRAAGNLRRPG